MSHKTAKRTRQSAKRASKAVQASSSHRRKLARAELHIECVEAMVKGWLRDGYRTFEKTNREGRFVFFAEQVQPLPDQLALAIGDALHCLRNSLDHIVFSLSTKHTPAIPPKKEKDISFPVSDNAIDVIDKRIAFLSGPAQQAICELAPDPGRQQLDQDPIWLLHKADNRDKHRELPVVVANAGPEAYRLYASDGTDYFQSFNVERLQLGAPAVRLFEYTRSPRVHAEITFTAKVVFDESVEVANREVIATLRWFHDHIRDTVFKGLEPHL